MQPTACFAAALFLGMATAAMPAPVDDLRASTVAIRDRLAEVQSAYDRLVARDLTADDLVLSLNLKSREGTFLLRLDLHGRGKRGLWGAAYSPSQKWIHRVDADALVVAKQATGRRVTGPVTVHFATADDIAADGTPSRVAIKLNLLVAGNEVTGTFDAERAAELQFTASGVVDSGAGTPVPTVPPRPQCLKLEEVNSATLYLLCRAWERHALGITAMVRAIEHARLTGSPVPELLGQHPVHIPERPAFIQAASKPAHAKPGSPTPPPKEDAEVVPGLDEITAVDATKAGGAGKDKSDLDSLTARTREDAPELAAKRLTVARDIARHMERLASSAKAQVELGRQADAFVVNTLTTDDPEFGPWYGFQPLPRREGHVNVVGADAGSDGPQQWLNVEDWRVLGPFRTPAFVPLQVPDILDTEHAIYQVYASSQVIMSGTRVASEIHTPETNSWRAKACEPATGTIRPWQYTAPRGHELDHPGLGDATFYFASTIWSERDVEAWAGACVDDAALIWVNERLACSMPQPEKRTSIESVSLFRIRLKKGLNTVVVRLDNDQHSTGLWLRLCVRGKPRTAAEAKSQMEAARERAATLKATPDNVRGWRGNWSGVYPDASPPLAWDMEQRINVRWRARIGWSKAAPVVTTDRVFATSEPIFLVCVDKMTGKVLWEREMNILELKDPKLYAESQDMLKVWKNAETELRTLENDPSAASPSSGRIKELGGIVRDGQAKWWDFVHKKGGVHKVSIWGNYLGLMFATPVTDGNHVWVKCAAGVTACFDMEGNRKWMVQTDYPYNGMTLCSSPILIDGRLIFELPTRTPGMGEGAAQKEPILKMVGHDAATGKVVWEAQPVYNMQISSSPVPMRLTNGKEEMAVVVTGGGRGPEVKKNDLNDVLHLGGTVVRAEDGKILIGNLGVTSGWSSPVVVGDRVYHIGPFYSTCTRLVMVNRDVVGAVRVWTQDTAGHDSGVVPNDDILSGLDGGQWPGRVHYYEQATGIEISKKVNLNTIYGKFCRGYTPASTAGRHVFIADDGTGFGWYPDRSKVFVVQSGRNGRLVARNKLESNMVPAPTFDGDRMYARTVHSLMCIGHTGDEGRAYEAEVVARTLMEDIPPAPPKAGEERAVGALPRVPVGVSPFAPVPAHQTWHFVGPYPASESNAVLNAMGGPTLDGYRPGTNKNESGVKDLYMDVWNNRKFSIRRASQMLDLTAPMEYQTNALAIYYWAFETKQSRPIRVISDRQDVDLWISGTKVVNQDRLNLAAGKHVVMIRFITPDSDTPPSQTLMDLQLADSSDAADDVRAWRESVESNRAALERVIKLRPDSETAKEAKVRLSQL